MQKNLLPSQEERVRTCKYYAKNLRYFRKMIGLKQSELADAVGTTQRHISEIENGKASISWTLMLALSAVFVIDLRIQKEDVNNPRAEKGIQLGRHMI